MIPTEAQQRQIDEQKLKDLKAKNYFFQALDRSILETILKKDTTKDIWDFVKKNSCSHRSSNIGVQNKIPEEAWSGVKPSVGGWMLELGRRIHKLCLIRIGLANDNKTDAGSNNDPVEEMEEEDEEEGSAEQEEAREKQRPRRQHT
ncbi:hypothetical protein Salat_2512100 [Sesamum alatum]|uniref:Retrovirus-related Pol polyprotein from transposon TNT 1-94 n=1 Tax=Sesamum alatum TaxID=300844 RepID=A0AAE1XSN3_9LAMI|nr:hypothetical protein Salat_2512100 [Sesamum alatum]